MKRSSHRNEFQSIDKQVSTQNGAHSSMWLTCLSVREREATRLDNSRGSDKVKASTIEKWCKSQRKKRLNHRHRVLIRGEFFSFSHSLSLSCRQDMKTYCIESRLPYGSFCLLFFFFFSSSSFTFFLFVSHRCPRRRTQVLWRDQMRIEKENKLTRCHRNHWCCQSALISFWANPWILGILLRYFRSLHEELFSRDVAGIDRSNPEWNKGMAGGAIKANEWIRDGERERSAYKRVSDSSSSNCSILPRKRGKHSQSALNKSVQSSHFHHAIQLRPTDAHHHSTTGSNRAGR